MPQGVVSPQFGAVSVVQRWSGSLRVYPHWHILVADGAWARTEHGEADEMPFVTAPPLREEQLKALLLDLAKRVTLEVDRHFPKRVKMVCNDDDPLQAADPSFAAVLGQSLFGKDELKALKAPPGEGRAPATPRRWSAPERRAARLRWLKCYRRSKTARIRRKPDLRPRSLAGATLGPLVLPALKTRRHTAKPATTATLRQEKPWSLRRRER